MLSLIQMGSGPKLFGLVMVNSMTDILPDGQIGTQQENHALVSQDLLLMALKCKSLFLHLMHSSEAAYKV